MVIVLTTPINGQVFTDLGMVMTMRSNGGIAWLLRVYCRQRHVGPSSSEKIWSATIKAAHDQMAPVLNDRKDRPHRRGVTKDRARDEGRQESSWWTSESVVDSLILGRHREFRTSRHFEQEHGEVLVRVSCADSARDKLGA